MQLINRLSRGSHRRYAQQFGCRLTLTLLIGACGVAYLARASCRDEFIYNLVLDSVTVDAVSGVVAETERSRWRESGYLEVEESDTGGAVSSRIYLSGVCTEWENGLCKYSGLVLDAVE